MAGEEDGYSKPQVLRFLLLAAFGLNPFATQTSWRRCIFVWFVLTTIMPLFHSVKYMLGLIQPTYFPYLVAIDGYGGVATPDTLSNDSSSSNNLAEGLSEPPSASAIVKTVLIASTITSVATNLFLRIILLILRNHIRELCQEFLSLNCMKQTVTWTRNELSFAVLVMLTSLERQYSALSIVWQKFNADDYASPSPLVSLIYLQFRDFYAQGFQIDVMNLLLLCVLTSIARSLYNTEEESKLQALGIDESLLPRKLLRREKFRCLMNKYIAWRRFWKNAKDVLGFILVLVYCKLFLSLSFAIFILITASIDLGFTHTIAIERLVDTILSFGKILCLGNVAHELKLATRFHFREMSKLVNFKGREVETVMTLKSYIGTASILMRLSSKLTSSFELSAMKFFTVSREALTTFAGLLVTYLVALMQFQISAVSKSNTSS